MNKTPVSQLNKNELVSEAEIGSGIRTMGKDMAALAKTGALPKEKPLRTVAKAAPPVDLPVIGEKPVAGPPVTPLARPKAEPSEQARPAPESKALPPVKKKITRWQLALILGIIGLVGISGGFFYWWRYLKAPSSPKLTDHYECIDYQCIKVEGEGLDQCLINKDCEVPEPDIPLSFISVDEIQTLEIDFSQESIINQLKSELAKGQATDTLKQILVKRTNPEKKEYADLKTVASLLEINLPPSFYYAVATPLVQGEDYALVCYGQEEGGRLGIIISLKEDSQLEEGLKAWEETILADLQPLLLQDMIPEVATSVMQDGAYKGVAIRYINFPAPDLSIDYALLKGKLMITTSKDSAYAVIDYLLSSGIESDLEETGDQETDSGPSQ